MPLRCTKSSDWLLRAHTLGVTLKSIQVIEEAHDEDTKLGETIVNSQLDDGVR